MRIGCDLDGTVVDFQSRWAELYANYFDREIDPEKLDTWDCLLTETQFVNGDAFFAWFDRAGGWDNLPWIPGARGGIDRLIAAGHTVEFITARQGSLAQAATQRWLGQSPWRGQGLDVYSGVEDKLWVPCNLYIDDRPSTVENVADNGRLAIVYDQPWNRQVAERPLTLRRAYNWDEVVDLVDSVEDNAFALEEELA